jgi:histone deacetylase complex regulatory component SIN3
LKSRTSLEVPEPSCPSTHRLRPRIRCRPDFRALLPSKSRTREPAITPSPEPLLSWGSPALGRFPLPTLASHETLPLSHFHSPPRRPARCPRVLLPEERHSSEERAYPSAVSGLFSPSNLFDESFVDGLFFSPDVRSRITAESLPHP